MHLSGRALQRAQTVSVVLPSFVLFGYNLSGVGGLLSISDFADTFNPIDTVHTSGAEHDKNSTVQGVVVATLTLGALAGSLACTWVGDVLGRRKTAFFAGACTLIGEILQCTSFQLPQFVIGRFIVGLGVGALSTSVPVWQSECSEAKSRGKHVVIDGMFICLGYFLQAWVNLGFFQIKHGSLSWRLPLAIPCAISAILLASVFLFPESPRWLAKRGDLERARSTLAKLRDLPADGIEIANEMSSIEIALEETTGANRKRDLFVMGEHKLLYRFMLCMVLQFLQQWCGTNLISVYSTVIFQQGLGLDSQTSRILSGGMLTWKLCSSLVAFFTIDRFGRRKLFMVSGAGMSTCMLVLAVATSFPKSNLPAQIVSVIFVFLFNFFVPVGFLGCNYLYVTEIAPGRLRMPMTSFSTANHWLWNFAILMITPVAIDSIGYRYYILYTVMGGIIPLLVYFFFPETMGRSLEQMEDLFRENPTIYAVVRESLKPPTSWEDTEAKAVSKGIVAAHKEFAN